MGASPPRQPRLHRFFIRTKGDIDITHNPESLLKWEQVSQLGLQPMGIAARSWLVASYLQLQYVKNENY